MEHFLGYCCCSRRCSRRCSIYGSCTDIPQDIGGISYSTKRKYAFSECRKRKQEVLYPMKCKKYAFRICMHLFLYYVRILHSETMFFVGEWDPKVDSPAFIAINHHFLYYEAKKCWFWNIEAKVYILGPKVGYFGILEVWEQLGA
jgi:hypothetical protein